MKFASKDLLLLAVGQALTSTVVSLLTSVSSLSGVLLSPDAQFSTLPVTATVFGTLIMTYPASTIMGLMGRRIGFMIKALIGISGGLICALALYYKLFIVLILGTFVLGLFNAFSQYYRFAAIDAASSIDKRAKFVAVVSAAGVVGGVLGPFLGERFNALFQDKYTGSFLALSLVCVAIAISQIFLSPQLGRNDAPTKSQQNAKSEGNDLSVRFYALTAVCAVGFSLMTLTMNAAPLAISRDPLCTSSDVTFALQLHFVAMYLPAVFNTVLLRVFGKLGLVWTGIVAYFLMALSALLLPSSPEMYVIQLMLSGIGWNFVFNGSTLLVATTYTAEQKTRAQGLNSQIVFSANAVASLLAGYLVVNFGWQTVHLACLPILAFSAFLIWAIDRHDRSQVEAS